MPDKKVNRNNPYAQTPKGAQPPDTFKQHEYHNKYKVYLKSKTGNMFCMVEGNQRKWLETATMQWFEKYPSAWLYADKIVFCEEVSQSGFEKMVGHKFEKVELPNVKE